MRTKTNMSLWQNSALHGYMLDNFHGNLSDHALTFFINHTIPFVNHQKYYHKDDGITVLYHYVILYTIILLRYIFIRGVMTQLVKKEEDPIGTNGHKLEDINCLHHGLDVL